MEHRISSFVKHAYRLKEIRRKGWERAGVEEPESVACHSYMVALLSMLLGDALELDTEKMMKMALLHDVAESVTGDITPHEMEREEKREKENCAMEELLSLTHRQEYRELWKEFLTGESREAQMVRELDKLEMVVQARIYARICGNLEEFLREENHITSPLLRALLDELP